MATRMRIQGLVELRRTLRHITGVMPGELKKAMKAEAEIEMTEMKRRTPVDTGNLRASGRVEGPEATGKGLKLEWVFGGTTRTGRNVDYAIRVHEDLSAWHRVGQAKFVESVIRESAAHLANRVARRIQLERVG